ncbi:RluA family pseudouridine synthase [Ligilactobacillus ceti]|uniref:Pseudouridine synthase n=1 Tax=Ligilactobacillus ceti DSM 22408 TaxID=1122146 RepID=A0A0R2KI80_9LACO|nr:RluA family pseudouridine synthase [Ligilactobacillus ceti]KRN89071.1 pseudouridine synthase [Ligilactobacillus ceti DSM 22408]
MEFKWKYEQATPMKLRNFLKAQGLSRRLLAKIRHSGGEISVAGKSGRVVDKVYPGDIVVLRTPPEETKNQLVKSFVPIEVLYEDRDYLIVNKPAHLASIPAALHPDDSLINRILGYYHVRGYRGIIPHIMTRLDRDTSGVVLLAKHGYAQAVLEQNQNQYPIQKEYYALLSGNLKIKKALINLPIGRDENSLFKRKVTTQGKNAQTELKVKQNYAKVTLCKIKLHTGRTHQIRVHCAYLGHPLVSDEMYQGKQMAPLERQGLHCYQIKFYHPFKKEMIQIKSPLPTDIQVIINKK